jgi:tripartite-type tricarboxylate transporter receptor subunit TctC
VRVSACWPVRPALAEHPDKPIRIMAPYATGGNIDVTARIIADKLKDMLGVSVLVENKASASGMIGSDTVARSAPDGYKLLVSAAGTRRTTGEPRSSRSATSRRCQA